MFLSLKLHHFNLIFATVVFAYSELTLILISQLIKNFHSSRNNSLSCHNNLSNSGLVLEKISENNGIDILLIIHQLNKISSLGCIQKQDSNHIKLN
jgi:hypothetical protein